MAMPIDLVLVRHGRSEANEIQSRVKNDPSYQIPEGFHDRHDSEMILAPEGERQARITGEWLRNEFPNRFDHYTVSPHARTLKTAGLLALNGNWKIDDLWRERDWGEYGILNDEDRERHYKLAHKLYHQNRWYWCPPGGESLATGVRLRFEDRLDTMHREMADETQIVVAHGEVIDVASFVLERLIPQKWLIRDRDPNYKIKNTQVLHYSRRNPDTGEIVKRITWRRSICPWDESASWFGGAWMELEHKTYSDEELIELADTFPPLLPNEGAS